MIVAEVFAELEGFEWNNGNINKNRLKHDVNILECEEVFFNKPIIVLTDLKHSEVEERYRILGITAGKRKLALAITIRNKRIRVIMARDQSRKERILFDKEKTNNE